MWRSWGGRTHSTSRCCRVLVSPPEPLHMEPPSPLNLLLGHLKDITQQLLCGTECGGAASDVFTRVDPSLIKTFPCSSWPPWVGARGQNDCPAPRASYLNVGTSPLFN